ncbi:hypothetical protein RCF34_14010 [Pseudomonas sp. 102515]|uniref:hypothetical protein n=1 Tax=Pseudomonas sp. 102515 TaxID=3071568 RepID=UPI002800F0A9|nr:hypothetical protein [Pseudomonas sp. 102515]MDQ7914223.1 hypothetical protein [Pseudomonas sp. 102515]
MRQLIWRAVREQCLRRRSLAALVLLVVFLLAPQVGQPSLDRLQAWTAWLETHATLLVLWRLCLYGLTAWGWYGLHQRVRAREGSLRGVVRLYLLEGLALSTLAVAEWRLWAYAV